MISILIGSCSEIHNMAGKKKENNHDTFSHLLALGARRSPYSFLAKLGTISEGSITAQ